jgi:hypothetical protein
MSLISLASTTKNEIQQQPYNFKNHFPQPLIIKPHSQVCLVNFYHFRDEGYYRIVDSNNTIAFFIGSSRDFSSIRYAVITNGKYTGADLATEIARAMNAVLLQENYTFSCSFTEGNPVANPPTTDSFTISYANVATPSAKGGVWSQVSISTGTSTARRREGGNLTITNNDTTGNKSIIKNNSSDNKGCSAILRKGLRLHEGQASWEGIGTCGFAQSFTDGKPHSFICGIMRSGVSCDDNGVPFDTENKAHLFDSGFADIRVQLRNSGDNSMKMNITTLNQKRGTTSLYQPNNKGKVQTLRRKIASSFFDAVFNDANNQDRMKIIIHINSGIRCYVVCLQKSTDGGQTYSDIPDGTGGNALDGRPVVYSQTISGVPYTSVIYSTNGVPDGAGGNVANSKIANLAIVKYAPLFPYCNLGDNFNHIVGVDLTNLLINASTDNAGIGADQVFQMLFNDDTSGNGYDYFLDVSAVAPTPDANINSTAFDQLAFKEKSGSGNGLFFDVYTNNLTPIGSATPIAELRVFPNNKTHGDCSFVGLSPPQLNPMVFDFDASTGRPIPLTNQAEVGCQGIFNAIGNLASDAFGVSSGGEHEESLHFDENGNDILETDTTTHAGLGVDFDQPSVFLVDRPSQADIATFRNNPAKLTGDVVGGSIGASLGLTQNVYSIASGVNTLSSDGFPFKEQDDNSIHISIPELSNTKSFEGEAENTGKTIKVIPKNEFTQSSTNGSMTFIANYEDWIDINNENELHINELTMQVRKPDGKMAVSLQPITRATIKIQQDPEVRAMARQQQLIDAIQRQKGANQDTGSIPSFNKPSYVGS